MILKIENLKKYYGENKAVDDISFEVQSGEIFALLGPNGAGKTTTLKCILELRKPDFGNIILNGTYSYLPEKKELYHYLTVSKMLDVTEELSKKFSKENAIKLLKDFKIPLNEKIANLSHGMLTQVYVSSSLFVIHATYFSFIESKKSFSSILPFAIIATFSAIFSTSERIWLV